MELVSKTNIGQRKINEDSYLTTQITANSFLAVVADGMGGHKGGKIASELAVTTIEAEVVSLTPKSSEDFLTLDEKIVLKRAIKTANKKIYSLAQEQIDLVEMGTTVVAAIIKSAYFVVAHVGDSRAYLFTDNMLKQLTIDHSYVQELLNSGDITALEAYSHPKRNLVTRAIGSAPEVEVEINKFNWSKNDILLICTDGLIDIISEQDILNFYREQCCIEDLATVLISTAETRESKDNVTFTIIKNTLEEEVSSNAY